MNPFQWASGFWSHSDRSDESDKDESDKNVKKGEFSPEADEVRRAFFEFKKDHPEVKSVDEMNALQRRMQSGSV